MPTIAPVKCEIPFPGEKSSSALEVVLQDLSCGGMAVIDSNGRDNFEKGSVYENCSIALPGTNTANVFISITGLEQTHTGLVNGLTSADQLRVCRCRGKCAVLNTQ